MTNFTIYSLYNYLKNKGVLYMGYIISALGLLGSVFEFISYIVFFILAYRLLQAIKIYIDKNKML